MGECPSQALKDLVRGQLEEAERAEESKTNNTGVLFDKSLDKFHQKVVAKLNETIGLYEQESAPLRMLKLKHGSFYGEDGKTRKDVNRGLPSSGYFEIHNKSHEVSHRAVHGPNVCCW